MKALNISEARSTLPALVEAVSTTHVSVVLLRYGKPAAMIVPVQTEEEKAEPYPLRKLPITVADDFDEPSAGLWEALGAAETASQYAATKKSAGRAKPKRRKP